MTKAFNFGFKKRKCAETSINTNKLFDSTYERLLKEQAERERDPNLHVAERYYSKYILLIKFFIDLRKN
jgi:hypothetical protein